MLSVNDAPKTASKNFNVADEFKKAKMKNSASFVVVGTCCSNLSLWTPTNMDQVTLITEKAH